MACILKKPGTSKGIITFTTREWDRAPHLKSILDNKTILNTIKKDWIIGLHANWQSDKFQQCFDFGLGRKGWFTGCPNDKLIEMDASCFCTSEFYPSSYENKFWDIIGAGKTHGTRSLIPFLHVIRKIYNTGYFPRVILLAGIPEKPCDLLSTYKSMFNHYERERFNLIDIKYNYPFPWDYETLAHYIRQSKIFLGPETRGLPCRTYTCAIGSGLPFVSPPWKIPIVPKNLLNKPAHYFGSNVDQLAEQCIDALNSYTPETQNNINIKNSVDWLNFDNAMIRLKNQLAPILETTVESLNSEHMNLNNLHIRIARHHGSWPNLTLGSNNVDMEIEKLVDIITNNIDLIDITAEDVELSLLQSLNLKR